jgi:amidohydrolase family protein
MSRRALWIALAIAFAGRPAVAQEAGSMWAITGATMIDGTGTSPMEHAVIVGQGERITCAGPPAMCPVGTGAAMMDATGKWILPGLIDTHIHPSWADRPAEADRDQLIRFALGITTTRDAGTPRTLEKNLAARVRANSPAVPQPRLVVSGLVSKDNLHRYGGSDDTALVHNLAALGVDAIKIKDERSDEVLGATIAAAHREHLPIFGHTWWAQSQLLGTVTAGIDGVSHMAAIAAFARLAGAAQPGPRGGVDYWVSTKEVWNEQDAARQAEAIDLLITHGTWFEPMLASEEHFTLRYPVPAELAYAGDAPTFRSLIRPWIPGGESGWPNVTRRRARIAAAFGPMCDFVRRFHQHGGTIVAGTDNEQPGIALLDEVGNLVRCGLSPIDALRAATRHAAEALNARDRGTIQAGALADFDLLDADPLQDPANLRRVWRVVKGGRVYEPAVLMAPFVDAYRRELRAAYVQAFGSVGAILAGGAVLMISGRSRRRRRVSALSESS